MDYFDILLARNLASKGDITTESLSVTENGTYTAPQGKAYTPVTVSVQPPANSYQLKSITTPTSLATFEASAMPMPTLKASIKAKQDLHGYDKPWSAGGGKNKANINTTNPAVTVIKDNDGNVIGVRARTGAQSYVVTIKVGEVSIINGNTYTLSGSPQGYSNDTFRLDIRTHSTTNLYNNWNEYDNPTITATESVLLDIYIRVAVNYRLDDVLFQPQVEIGNQATSFAPYSNICPIEGWDNAIVTDTDDVDNPTITQTTTISLPQTVYGGELDVVNGTSGNKNTLGIVDLGDLTWGNSDEYGWTQSQTIDDAKPVSSSGEIGNIVCEIFEVMSGNDVYTRRYDNVISISTNGRLQVCCTQLANTSSANVRTWMTGHKLAYELATPTTFTTQPTPIKSLNGTNNLSVDCGEIIEGEYFKAL